MKLHALFSLLVFGLAKAELRGNNHEVDRNTAEVKFGSVANELRAMVEEHKRKLQVPAAGSGNGQVELKENSEIDPEQVKELLQKITNLGSGQ